MRTITLPAACNMHVHFRDELEDGGKEDPNMLVKVVNVTTAWCDYALPMPNTTDPVRTAKQAVPYYDAIMRINNNPRFQPVMSCQLTEYTNPHDIEHAAKVGFKVWKAYPSGMTHNSEHGIKNYWSRKMLDLYQALSDNDCVLCLHPEYPDSAIYWEDRERIFGERITPLIADRYPNLRLSIEHLSTAFSVRLVRSLHLTRGRIFGTISPLHLMITANDVVGGKLQPHNFCKPMAKRWSDRFELQQAAFQAQKEAYSCFGLGTDSAPHLRGKKECHDGCAGAFSDYVALPLTVELFYQNAVEAALSAFLSENARRFYQLEDLGGRVTLVGISEKEEPPWIVPSDFRGVEPFWAGKAISWQVQSEL